MPISIFKKLNLDKIEKIFISIFLVLSLGVIIGWFVGIYELLGITPEAAGATMKFNTAIIILLSGVLMFICREKKTRFRGIYKILASILIFIGVITIGEYLGMSFISIDNIFVTDVFSKSNPGRMSPATAICSILLGIGFLGNLYPDRIFGKIGLLAFTSTAILALVGIISFILLIPMANKTSLFQTMSINTSILFLLISTLQLFKNQNSPIYQILTGDFEGSKLARKIFPSLIIFPIVSSYLLIVGIHQNIITIDFGLVAYAAIFIPVGIIYLIFTALGLNKTDEERQKLAMELQKNNSYYLKRFKEGVDQVSSVSLMDTNKVITYVNDSFCKTTQYSREEHVGNTLELLDSGHHQEQFFIQMWETIESGEIWVGEIKNKAKDGSFYWVFTAIIPFKNDKDKITEYMSISQDITERKEAEELKMDYVKKLEYKNKELEQFAYVASHDLQEPLRTVINYTDLLTKRRAEHFDELGLKSLQFIQEATVRMSQLIKSLLDYNRIDNDNNLTLVDCNELINGIEIELSKEIKDTETTIIVEKLPSINGYESTLRMLFQNLITNAIKFRKEGIKPLITISAIRDGIGWEFSVKDNGIGISSEHKEKIFVIFQQLHNKNKYEGSGIGLSHCRKIVDLHGGKIWVESKLNEGSIFKFTIRTKGHE